MHHHLPFHLRVSRALNRLTIALGCLGLTAAASPTIAADAAVLTSGGDFRFRNEYLNSAFTLNGDAALHEQDYFRARTRLWLAANPTGTFSLFARIAAEPRYWTRPAFVKQHTGTGAEWRYAIVDALHVKWKTELGGSPLTLTLGRQDIQFGSPLDWWLVCDGTPSDGSFTMFMDAARLTLEAKAAKTRFDFVGIAERAHPDSGLPILGTSGTYSLVEQNERGFIAYASNNALRGVQLDGYYIYKQDRRVFSAGDDADLSTFGAKISSQVSPAWHYSAEAAWQTGTKRDPSVKTPAAAAASKRDVRACGWNGKLTYSLNDPLNQKISLVTEYLSGDDAATPGRDEMFDILWGRWPRFSELYIYSYTLETGGKIAQLNNLLRYGVTWSIVPTKGTTFSVAYNRLQAPQAAPTRQTSSALFSQNGHMRGDFFQCSLKRQFTPRLSGHLWAEWLRQGDFYSRRDTLTFLRAEIMTTF